MSGMILTPYKGTEPYIFLSYAHRNMEAALAIIERMQADGYRVWYDEGIDPGTEWDENIANHVENCSYFIALLSKEYLESSNCKDELNFARDCEKPRLLVYLTEVKLPSGMSMRLSRLQNIHKYKYSNDEHFYEKLYTAKGISVCMDADLKRDKGEDDGAESYHFVLYQKNFGKYRVELNEGSYIIGRDSNKCQIPVADSAASRMHALLTVTKKSVVLQDLNALNNSQINGEKVVFGKIITLKIGDVLTIGDTDFVLTTEDDEMFALFDMPYPDRPGGVDAPYFDGQTDDTPDAEALSDAEEPAPEEILPEEADSEETELDETADEEKDIEEAESEETPAPFEIDILDDEPEQAEPSVEETEDDTDGSERSPFTYPCDVPNEIKLLSKKVLEGADILRADRGDGVYIVENGYTEIDEAANSVFRSEARDMTGIALPYTILRLPNDFFAYCYELKRVILPDYIDSLPMGTFNKCINLERVDVPGNVSVIGGSAFKLCEKLSEITLPVALAEIGSYAFMGCTSLEEIVLPPMLKKIGYKCFYGCPKLKRIIIPKTIEKIGLEAFSNCAELEEIVIEEGAQKIELNSFRGVGSKHKLHLWLPNSVNDIEWCRSDNLVIHCYRNSYAHEFAANHNMSFEFIVDQPGESTEYEKREITDSRLKNFMAELTGNKAVGNVSTENRIKPANEAGSAFYKLLGGNSKEEPEDNFTYPQEVPDEIVNLPKRVFEYTDLSKANQGNGRYVLEYGYTEFSKNAARLLKIAIPSVTEFTLPDSTLELPDKCFKNCKELRSVKLPRYLRTIPSSAFENCKKLERIDIPGNVTVIERAAFGSCSALSSVRFPAYLREIGDSAFSLCSGLEKIVLPPSLESIGMMGFYACGLKEVTIPGSVKTIGQNAFKDCAKLEKVIIEEGVTSFSNSVFSSSKMLHVWIPDSVSEITWDIRYGNMVFHCRENSYAHVFAQQEKIPFWLIG